MLAKAEINSDDLADPIRLKSIEDRIRNKEILDADDIVILKLLRPSDSDNALGAATSYCQAERSILDTSIQEGPIRLPEVFYYWCRA